MRELRYHMVAGLFWYIVGVISWGVVVSETYGWLRSNLGRSPAILVDLTAVVVIFAIAFFLWAWTSGLLSSLDQFRTIDVHAENTTAASVLYKSKVRITLQNDSGRTVEVRDPIWVANGNVHLDLPPQLKLQVESIEGGRRSDRWSDEARAVHVPPGWAFRTWIGLGERRSEADFGRTRESRQFGTLSLTIRRGKKKLRIPI